MVNFDHKSRSKRNTENGFIQKTHAFQKILKKLINTELRLNNYSYRFGALLFKIWHHKHKQH